jgi:hypothetical protein
MGRGSGSGSAIVTAVGAVDTVCSAGRGAFSGTTTAAGTTGADVDGDGGEGAVGGATGTGREGIDSDADRGKVGSCGTGTGGLLAAGAVLCGSGGTTSVAVVDVAGDTW